MTTHDHWVRDVMGQIPGFEDRVFANYSKRLLAFARSRLPQKLSRRVDEDDIVQSVFRSFFRRNAAGDFVFDESHDVWQLLAAITYRKVIKASRYHGRDVRNVAKEQSVTPDALARATSDPGPEDLAVMAELTEKLFTALPETHREILRLRLEGHNIGDTAQAMSVSERTVRRVLERTREMVADKMDL